MKIFVGSQIRELDAYTIEHEPISSIDLMERAAKALSRAIMEKWSVGTPMVFFCGPGNNGGDGLAIARILADNGYNHVSVYLFNIHSRLSEDCEINKQRLEKGGKVETFVEVKDEFDPPKLDETMVVIDSLFGTGLNKPLGGGFADLVKYINASKAKVVSIDVPSGLMTEDNTMNVMAHVIHADYTFTLQTQKLAFLLEDNQCYIGKLRILDIRLSREGMEKIPSKYSIVDDSTIRTMLLKRGEFAHKGTMGNALLLAGSYGMAGAAVLATRACMRSGAGKVTLHTAFKNNDIVQISIPEAIVSLDNEEGHITEAVDSSRFDAVGIGPGIGRNENTAVAVITQIRSSSSIPMVLDADALNILASHRAWLEQLPKGVILTPHPIELERLTNTHNLTSYERLSKVQELSSHLEAYVILKGHYSALCTPEGEVIFNSTGNAGMATAGSGDVLTGIIAGLLARGYNRRSACILGMYIHGLAGDIAAQSIGEESLIASDIIEYLPRAFKEIEN